MICRVCETERVPNGWWSVAWCDPCLTLGLRLRAKRPELSLHEVRDLVRAERGRRD